MMLPTPPEPAVSPWQSELSACQDEIARLCPNPYYRSAYRAAELTYWRHIPAWLYQDIQASPPASCLDIGCAYGTLLVYVRRLSGCAAFGMDFTPSYLGQELAQEYGLNFALANIELDPLPWQGAFDIILLTEVLEHWNYHPLPTLQKIRALLSPAGRLYLSTPDASEWGRVSKYYSGYRQMPPPSAAGTRPYWDDHVWVYAEDELREVLAEAGLQIERFAYSTGGAGRHFNLTLRRG